jgi:transcriptional regulator with XRE-family HTH domain
MSGKSPSPYGERLKQAMVLAGMAGPDGKLKRDARERLSRAIGVSVQSVGQVLNGDSKKFAPENSARAARFLRVDHFWLATGEGEPRPPGPSEEAISFARQFDKLDETGRKKFYAAIILAHPGVPDAEVEAKMPITRTPNESTH